MTRKIFVNFPVINWVLLPPPPQSKHTIYYSTYIISLTFYSKKLKCLFLKLEGIFVNNYSFYYLRLSNLVTICGFSVKVTFAFLLQKNEEIIRSKHFFKPENQRILSKFWYLNYNICSFNYNVFSVFISVKLCLLTLVFGSVCLKINIHINQRSSFIQLEP